jgi:hypothetical protein
LRAQVPRSRCRCRCRRRLVQLSPRTRIRTPPHLHAGQYDTDLRITQLVDGTKGAHMMSPNSETDAPEPARRPSTALRTSRRYGSAQALLPRQKGTGALKFKGETGEGWAAGWL